MIKTETELREFYEGRSVPPDHLLEEWIQRLCAGEKRPSAEGLSRYIIQDFILRTLFDQPQSKVTLRWLADVFERILDFEDPRVALTLPKRAKHRPAGIGVEKAIDVACWVRLVLDRGYNEAEANQLAAEVFSCEVRHVTRLRKEGQGWVEGMNPNNDCEEYFQLKKRPLPATLAQSNHGAARTRSR